MASKDKAVLTEDLSQLEEIAKCLLSQGEKQKVWLIKGEMGAGKTTFIRSLCKVLGVTDNVSSPTFPVINEYKTSKGDPVYHFDFYRIKNLEEAVALDCETYFESGYFCFIEWPSKVGPILPDKHIELIISPISSTKRKFTFSKAQ